MIDLELLILIARTPGGVPVAEVPGEVLRRHTGHLASPVKVQGDRAGLSDIGVSMVATARGLKRRTSSRCPGFTPKPMPTGPEADELDRRCVRDPDDVEARRAFAGLLEASGHLVAGFLYAGRELAEDAGYHGVSLRELMESR